MFDHKAIFISTVPKKAISNSIPTISHAIMRDPDLDYVVGLAVLDTYANSTACQRPGGWGDFLLQIGSAKEKLRRAAPSNIHLSPGDRSDFDDLVREGLIAEIREFFDSAPFNILRDGPLTEGVDPDFFMEGLMNNVRNEVISHQNFVLKKAKSNRLSILKRLADLKTDPVLNLDTIIELEKKLNLLVDQELRHELEKNPNFELLNNERMTPYFIQLSKGTKSEAKLTLIRLGSSKKNLEILKALQLKKV